MNPRSPVRPFFTLGFVLLVCGSGLASRAAAQVQYRTVALTGQPAPGMPVGVNYASFSILNGPALNDAGQTAYFAGLEGSGVTDANDRAIYAGPPASPQLVARTGDIAPGTPAGVNYISFESLVLNDAGQAGYLASLTGSGVTGANNSAIYAGPLAAPQLVAREGDAAAGTPAGVNYAFFGIFDVPVLNNAGQAAYFAGLEGSGVTAANDSAIYAGPLAALQLVAREGDAAPGTPAGVNYSSFSRLDSAPILNDAGQVAYLAGLIGSGVTNANGAALYAGPLAASQLVARAGDPAPGTPAGVNYLNFDSPVLNDANQAAYFARLTGAGVTIANNYALYAGPLAAPQVVARTGDAAPGTPTGVNYLMFAGPIAVNDAGHVAYSANLTGSGVTSANERAIYAGPFAAPQVVARTGDAAPGTPAGVRYSFISTPAFNDAGQVVFSAELIGSGVTSANNRGLFASDPTLGELLIARAGDMFAIGKGDFRTIADGGIGFTAGRNGVRTGLSNNGTLAFRLSFTDGTSGIFTATIVPEPAALPMLAAAGLTLFGCRSALRRRML